MSKSKILIQLTGSIAAYKTCELISTLVKNSYEVKVAASKNALNFVGAATLEGLSGSPVYSDLWEQGRMMDHIDLNRWADLIIVAPASASYINRIASGTGDDLLTTLFLAHDFKKPFLIAPAMNQAMYNHPVTQKSLLALQNMGIRILNPDTGTLACGEIGPGRLMEPQQIYKKIIQVLEPKLLGKVLVTSGGTSEAIDDVRVISNQSTGATGAAIADALSDLGFQVTFLSAKNSVKPKSECQNLHFSNFQDLSNSLQQELKNPYTAVIHTAAVSDYSPESKVGKISSEVDSLKLELRKNPKLVNDIRNWSANKAVKLIAFKLTSSTSVNEQKLAVEKLSQSSGADLIVHNDFQQFKNNSNEHLFTAYKNNQSVFEANNRQELAQRISQFLQETAL